ncbi:Acyl-coenzyme A thioesterase PaaI [compost metagenome]
MAESNAAATHHEVSTLPQQGLDPLLTHLGIFGVPLVDEDNSTIRLELKPYHMNGHASAHGGVLMTLMDVVLAWSTRQHGDGRGCVTVELKTNFMRPGGGAGNVLVASGKVRSAGKSLAFCDGEIRTEAGELVATASAIFKYVGKPTNAC